MESILPSSLQGVAPLIVPFALIAAPKLIRQARELRQRLNTARAAAARQGPEAARSALRRIAVVTSLTLVIIVVLIRITTPTQDVFSDNRLSILGTPTSHLSYLLRRDPARDQLIDIISSRIGRTSYARFGHDAVLGCAWCAGDDDRWIASIPSTLGFWLASLAAITGFSYGASTTGGGIVRKLANWTCGAAAVLELWARSEWGPGTWRPAGPGHDLMHVNRYVHLGRMGIIALVIFNAFTLYLSPPSLLPTQDTSTSQLAADVFLALNSASGSQAYLRAIRTAELRDPDLRKLATLVGEQQARISENAQRQIRSIQGEEFDAALNEVRGKARTFARGGWDRLSVLTAAIESSGGGGGGGGDATG